MHRGRKGSRTSFGAGEAITVILMLEFTLIRVNLIEFFGFVQTFLGLGSEGGKGGKRWWGRRRGCFWEPM